VARPAFSRSSKATTGNAYRAVYNRRIAVTPLLFRFGTNINVLVHQLLSVRGVALRELELVYGTFIADGQPSFGEKIARTTPRAGDWQGAMS